jgi:hypothetical protein
MYLFTRQVNSVKMFIAIFFKCNFLLLSRLFKSIWATRRRVRTFVLETTRVKLNAVRFVFVNCLVKQHTEASVRGSHRTNLCFVMTSHIQGGSNMTGTNCDLFTHNQSRSYLNHLVYASTTSCKDVIFVWVLNNMWMRLQVLLKIQHTKLQEHPSGASCSISCWRTNQWADRHDEASDSYWFYKSA